MVGGGGGWCQTVLSEKDGESMRFVRIERHEVNETLWEDCWESRWKGLRYCPFWKRKWVWGISQDWKTRSKCLTSLWFCQCQKRVKRLQPVWLKDEGCHGRWWSHHQIDKEDFPEIQRDYGLRLILSSVLTFIWNSSERYSFSHSPLMVTLTLTIQESCVIPHVIMVNTSYHKIRTISRNCFPQLRPLRLK